MDKDSEQLLFSEFPFIDTGTWLEKIKSDLKGADFTRKLVYRSDEGFELDPFYRSEDLENLRYLENTGSLKPPSSSPNGWILCQYFAPAPDPVQGNQAILEAIQGGVQALLLPWNPPKTSKPDYLGSLLKGIRPDETEIHFQGNLEADAIYQSLVKVASEHQMALSDLKGCLGADPLGVMASTGTRVLLTENIGKLVRTVLDQSPGMKTISVNGAMIQDAGSTLVQELGFALSMANEYMDVLTGKGVDPEDAARSLQFSLASGPDFFMEISKLRAARVLWNALCEGYGIESGSIPVQIHSVTARWNMTLYDPHVNMLRATTEAMASVLGGADLITVLPYDLLRKGTHSFSNRMARNVQNIIRDEAYLDKVADPAAGSYYVEKLTDFIAEGAWDLFRKTESDGGFLKAFEDGLVQEQIEGSRHKKEEKTASGKFHLLGTNAYPNALEMALPLLENEPAPGAAVDDPPPQLRPISPYRASGEFDRLRLQTESSGKRPRVFLFKFGDPGWATARANFAGNFFACAGYEITDPPVQPRIDLGIDLAHGSGADLVVLCSADETYPDLARQVAGTLGEKAMIVVAGQPGDMKEELEKTGVNDFIHMKVNLLEKLNEFNRILLEPKPGNP